MQFYKFVVGPSGRGGFNVVSTDASTHPVVASKGNKGCTFVHVEKFLAAFGTLEQAKYCAAVSYVASYKV